MPFLPPNQQRQSTEGHWHWQPLRKLKSTFVVLHAGTTLAACSCRERTRPGRGVSLRFIASTRQTCGVCWASDGNTTSLWMTPSSVARNSTLTTLRPTELPTVTSKRSTTSCVNLQIHSVTVAKWSSHIYASWFLPSSCRWLGSRVVSVLDSGAEGPGFKSQPRRCRVTVLGKLFIPVVPLFTKQRNCSSPLTGCGGNCGPGGK